MTNETPKVVVLGAGGMLGRALGEALDAAGVPNIKATRSEVDLATASFPDVLASSGADTVINAAAWTDVDGAEQHEKDATEINGHAVGRLANACRDAGVKLVHYSTDYVFDGTASEPYAVDHPRDPVNAYGRSKAAGEELIEASGVEHLTLRTSWVYAPWGTNFVLTMAKLVRERDELNVVDDQRGRPTSAVRLAQSTLALLRDGRTGMMHATDAGECTWFEFACAIRDAVRAQCDIKPCTSDAFPRPAVRPAYSVLDVSLTESAIGPLELWGSSLEAVLAGT